MQEAKQYWSKEELKKTYKENEKIIADLTEVPVKDDGTPMTDPWIVKDVQNDSARGAMIYFNYMVDYIEAAKQQGLIS